MKVTTLPVWMLLRYFIIHLLPIITLYSKDAGCRTCYDILERPVHELYTCRVSSQNNERVINSTPYITLFLERTFSSIIHDRSSLFSGSWTRIAGVWNNWFRSLQVTYLRYTFIFNSFIYFYRLLPQYYFIYYYPSNILFYNLCFDLPNLS